MILCAIDYCVFRASTTISLTCTVCGRSAEHWIPDRAFELKDLLATIRDAAAELRCFSGHCFGNPGGCHGDTEVIGVAQ